MRMIAVWSSVRCGSLAFYGSWVSGATIRIGSWTESLHLFAVWGSPCIYMHGEPHRAESCKRDCANRTRPIGAISRVGPLLVSLVVVEVGEDFGGLGCELGLGGDVVSGQGDGDFL